MQTTPKPDLSKLDPQDLQSFADDIQRSQPSILELLPCLTKQEQQEVLRVYFSQAQVLAEIKIELNKYHY